MKRRFALLVFIGPAAWLLVSLLPGCSLTATRPTQDMADTSAAIKAAREVGAQDIAPDYYRQSVELYTRAKTEYRIKNFELAQQYAEKARRYAEQAEFLAVKGAGKRDPEMHNIPPQDANKPPPDERIAPAKPPEEFETQTPMPVEDYVQQQQQKQQAQPAPTPGGQPTLGTTIQVPPVPSGTMGH